MIIKRYRGDTSPIRRQIKSKSTGDAIDITGWSFLLTVNTERYPDDASNQSFQITGTIITAASGIVYFTPTSSQPTEAGDYWFDIQATDDSGGIETIEHDAYKVTQDITK